MATQADTKSQGMDKMLEEYNETNELEFEIEEIRTKNTSFSIDQIGHQCGPLQYIRELTQNSIDAILNSDNQKGEIYWTYDRQELKETGVHKLCIIDNGPSMNGEEIRDRMNHMYSSDKTQDLDGNFGIGAKVAGLYRSPEGLLYHCFKDGKGYFAHLVKRPSDGAYGLKQLQQKDGSLNPYDVIPYYAKPKQVKNNGSATMVTLLGNSKDEDTFTSPPEGEYGNAWLSRYLNSRYFSLPEDIEIKVSYRTNPNQQIPDYRRRTILGAKHFLDKYKKASGIVEVTGAKMHWWVLDENFKSQNIFTGNAHTGSLYQDEIYDVEVANRTSRSRLNRCGIIHLINRVVIYAEPTTDGVTSDPSRTSLLVGKGKKIPWYDLADEFFEKLPEEISILEQAASEKASDKNIDDQIRYELSKLLRIEIPKYSISDNGEYAVSPPVDEGGIAEPGGEATNEREIQSSVENPRGARGNRYSDFISDDGTQGRRVPPSKRYPKVEWVTHEQHPHLEDRAAQFIRTQNRLLINEDFRAFKHLIDEIFDDKGGRKPGAKSIIIDQCKTHWAVKLSETVLRIQGLKSGGQTWKQNSIDSALSEDSLTAAVMGLHYLRKSIKTSVALRIGAVNKSYQKEQQENKLLIQ